MSVSNKQRYNFIFNLQSADEAFAKTELGEVEPQVTISVSATNERRAVIAASAVIQTLKQEHWADQFNKAMDSGNYTTSIERS